MAHVPHRSAAPPTPPRVLRQFAGLWLAAGLSVAVWQWIGHDRPGVAGLCAVVALGPGLAGLWRPAVIRPVFSGWMTAAAPVGWAVSRLALALVYYGVVTPIALVFRLTGRDRLGRARRPAGSHWRRKPPPAPGSYFRQF